MKRLALDTETTGLDMKHGTKPYFITTCDDKGNQLYWEWDVDPITREVRVPERDRKEVQRLLSSQDEIVLHNAKFDIKALNTVGVSWDWDKYQTHDTLLLAHLLKSSQQKNLTALTLNYLGKDVEPYEKRLEDACQKARRICRTHLKEWKIAKKGLRCMPSAKEKVWKFDTWLPKAICRLAPELLPETKHWKHGDNVGKHDWQTVATEYANLDSASTIALWLRLLRNAKSTGLWTLYEEVRRDLVRITYNMEEYGVTVSHKNMRKLVKEYKAESDRLTKLMVGIARNGFDYNLSLPKSGTNESLSTLVFDVMGLESPKLTEKGNPSMDKEVLDEWCLTLPHRSEELLFIESLRDKRKRDTALSYMEGYERFWLPYNGTEDEKKGFPGWFVLHPSLNITGSNTLRFSSSNPNQQNISKQEGFNLRFGFAPPPGWEWWSLDAQNIELRIPAFESGEEALMNVFLRPNDPPYYGSYHLVIFDVLHPDKFKKYGAECKDIFKSTWYQWVKNGNFATIYGAQKKKADATYRVPGAYDLIQDRFPNIAALNKRQIDFARKHGFVETIRDRNVDCKRGYPLYCSRSDYGDIIPTTPLNYHVQGTAMYWMCKAMIRTEALCSKWQSEGFPAHLIMQVHDEINFAMPKSDNFPDPSDPYASNLWRIIEIKKAMELGGEDIGVPTPCGIDYHPENWGKGIGIKVAV